MKLVQPNILLYFFLILLATVGFFIAIVWPQAEGFYSFISLAALGGLGVTFYIRYTKKHHQQLVCPVGSNCNAVINSRYSKFLGVSLEYFGMLYYTIILVSYLVLLFVPWVFSDLMLYGLVLVSAAAFLFSLYLLFIQAFILRQWCIWCLLSAMLSIGIFIASLTSLDFAVAYLTDITLALEVARSLGFALGIGGITTAVFLFYRFLSNLDIDEAESQTLKAVFELIWLGLVLIIVSQFAFYVVGESVIFDRNQYLAQMVAFFVILLSGAVMMLMIAPFLAAVPFGQAADSSRSPLAVFKKPAFIVVAIIFASWYYAFALNYISGQSFSFLILIYAIILSLAISFALIWERAVRQKAGANSVCPDQQENN